ncbi:MAG TPA: multiheme c-type cytochrome [Bryobacteraceae bacterium]|nr:multiheme c-type cytochrome [Bryobacteraceae bacterium]
MRRLLICVAFVLAGCGGPQGHHPKENFLEQVRSAEAKNVPAGLSSERYLEARGRAEAQGFPDVPTFYVLARTEKIEKLPCDRCHSEPLATLVKRQVSEPRRAHWSVELKHAKESVMTCATCHGQEKMTELKTLNGASVAFDHSYQICAQCHSKQVEDWSGGAHGKRAGGWAPPRVVFNCAECHDPHQPALAERWPAQRGERSSVR